MPPRSGVPVCMPTGGRVAVRGARPLHLAGSLPRPGRTVVPTSRSAVAAVLAAGILATPALGQDLALPRQKIELVAPPLVHPHEQATTDTPKILQFKLVTREKQIVIDPAGTRVQAMTFNNSIPGPLMVVHEGDYVEVTLVSPATNTMPHNIDFHAATGALGGGDLTLVSPGEQVVLRWK